MNLIGRCSSSFLEPSSSPSLHVLTLLRACKTIRNLKQVHAQIIRRGSEQDHYLINQFISLCNSISSDISYSTTVFERVIQPNIYVWNTLIKGYCEHSSLAVSLSAFIQLKRNSGVIPDKYSFPSLIKSCSSIMALREGMMIHALALRYGTDSDIFVASSLIDFYGKCREIVFARRLFNEMPLRNEVSWTAMIVGYVNVGNLLEAGCLFDRMPKRNATSYNAMISAFMRNGDSKSARKLFDDMPEKNAVSFTTMIDGYAKAGDMAAARWFFDQSPEKDKFSWSALIAGYVQNGYPNQAVEVFNEMLSADVKPDEYIMVGLMSACSQLGCIKLAKWVDSYMSQGSFDLHRGHVIAALVDMNAKCGNMDRAAALFEGMHSRDIISYCSMIQGLSIHGFGAEAVSLFDRMLCEGLKPDGVAFTVILSACSHAGLVDEGLRIFYSMINEFSFEPTPDHYACIVDLFGRSGKLRDAYELIKSKPLESHLGAWGALLGACKLYCEIDLGKQVAEKLFEHEPQNAGNYVMLSSIYAASDRWLEVSQLRSKMCEKGIKKVRGCSWI